MEGYLEYTFGSISMTDLGFKCNRTVYHRVIFYTFEIGVVLSHQVYSIFVKFTNFYYRL